MRQYFRLGRRRLQETVAQNLGDAPMQHLPATADALFDVMPAKEPTKKGCQR